MKSLLRFLVFPGIAVLGGLFIAFTADAAAVAQPGPTYEVVQSIPLPDLDKNHSRFRLQFDAQMEGRWIEFSCNGVISFITLDAGLQTELMVSPGTYKFQIYNSVFPELTTDSVVIEPGFETTIAVHLGPEPAPIIEENPSEIKVLKPVIYTYSDSKQAVDIQLNPKGKFTFTYPAYNKGWKGTANADGSFTSSNGKNYPYLFWEGEQVMPAFASDYSSGFVVKQGEVVAFLEDKLTQMGLNTKEQTDFITFWGPRMAQAEQGFVRFMFTEEYDHIASIHVSPKPDHLFRIYMLWTPLEKGISIPQPAPQKLEKVTREGFYLIEWGGSVLPESTFIGSK